VIWTVLGTVGVVGVTVVAGVLADRRWHLLPRKERLSAPRRPLLPRHPAGEAPSTALRVTVGEIEQLRRTQRCCRGVMESIADDEVHYEQQVLRILRFRCARCQTTRSVYVRWPLGEPG
jgi:hypothetical protein